jgi:Ca2+-binding RTX toxin-like protein
LVGSAFDDSLNGGNFNDTLNGSAGRNTLDGGAGNDSYIVNITGASLSNVIFNEIFDSQGVDRLLFTSTANELSNPDYHFGIRRMNDGKDLAIGIFDNPLSNPIHGVVIKNQYNFVAGSFNNTINSVVLKTAETGSKALTLNIAVTGSVDESGTYLIGTKGADFMTGFGGGQFINAGAGNDIITASRFEVEGMQGDIVDGEAGNDTIEGKEGNDTIDGGLGKDILTGGSGFDYFRFSTKLGKSNIDTITDFVSGVDKILLSPTIFSSINISESLNLLSGEWTARQKVNATASDGHLIFNTVNKGLYYDADGDGKGAAVQFATLLGVGSLSADDFDFMFSG